MRIVPRIRPPFDRGAFGVECALDVAEYITARYDGVKTFLVGAARQGLEVALRAAGLGSGDVVALADFNCSSVLAPLRHLGLRPALFDVCRDFSVDVKQLDAVVSQSSARAVVLTHYFGASCWTDELIAWAEAMRRHGVLIIEDAAHSFCDDAQPNIGRHGDVVLFSFGNDKPLSVGKGGAVLIRNEKILSVFEKEWCRLPVRDEAEERRLVAWHVFHSILSSPSRCVMGVPCVPPAGSAPSPGEFDELISAVVHGASEQEILSLPYARRIVGGWRAQNSLWGRVSRRFGLSKGPAAQTSTGLGRDVSIPVRMGEVSRRLFAGYWQAGVIDWANEVRRRNYARMTGACGRGSRLRYTRVYDCAERAMVVLACARKVGIEAGCFNWGSLLSASLGLKREPPSWAVRPEWVVNYPVHPYMTDEEVDLVARVVGRNSN